MKYKQLQNTYKSDTLANALYSREVEYFHYAFDATNFEHLLNNAPSGSDTKDIQERLVSTRKQMAAVDNTYKALESQITDQADHEEAVIRTTKKREEDEIRSDK
jgi:hypothetical protein